MNANGEMPMPNEVYAQSVVDVQPAVVENSGRGLRALLATGVVGAGVAIYALAGGGEAPAPVSPADGAPCDTVIDPICNPETSTTFDDKGTTTTTAESTTTTTEASTTTTSEATTTTTTTPSTTTSSTSTTIPTVTTTTPNVTVTTVPGVETTQVHVPEVVTE